MACCASVASGLLLFSNPAVCDVQAALLDGTVTTLFLQYHLQHSSRSQDEVSLGLRWLFELLMRSSIQLAHARLSHIATIVCVCAL